LHVSAQLLMCSRIERTGCSECFCKLVHGVSFFPPSPSSACPCQHARLCACVYACAGTWAPVSLIAGWQSGTCAPVSLIAGWQSKAPKQSATHVHFKQADLKCLISKRCQGLRSISAFNCMTASSPLIHGFLLSRVPL